MEWTAAAPGGSVPPASFTSGATTACTLMSSTSGSGSTFPAATMTERERCQMCLDVAGYYIRPGNTSGCTQGSCVGATNTSGDDGRVVFKGNFLNFYPPKFAIARKILTDFVKAQT